MYFQDKKRLSMQTEIINNKISEIIEKSNLAKNLARKKLIKELILAVLNCKNVQIMELSLHIKTKAKSISTSRRIQAFFQKFNFDYDLVARFILLFLPSRKLDLCIDRTEWDFGKFQCNILLVSVYFYGIGIPLFWELLDNKSGNSSAQNRIDLMEKCVNLLGSRINSVVGDREFIGIKWLKWLKDKKIGFCMRVPKSHSIILQNGIKMFVFDLLKGHQKRYFQGAIIDGIRCNVYLQKLNKNDYLFLVGSSYSKKLGEIYRKRWSIEVCFQSLKSRGFNLELSHLREREKMKKLLVLLSISLILCVKLGILLHHKKKKIKIKIHGYKANSFFRTGLNAWRALLKNQEKYLKKYLLLFLNGVLKRLEKNTYIVDNQIFTKMIV